MKFNPGHHLTHGAIQGDALNQSIQFGRLKSQGEQFIANDRPTLLIQFVQKQTQTSNLSRNPAPRGQKVQETTIVHPNSVIPKSQAIQNIPVKPQKFGLMKGRNLRGHHIGIALNKFPESALLRTIGPPYGLNLVSLERKAQFGMVGSDVASQGNGQVVTQGLFA